MRRHRPSPWTAQPRSRAAAQASVTTLAGSGAAGTADGKGTAAEFTRPAGLFLNKDGNLYVWDSSAELGAQGFAFRHPTGHAGWHGEHAGRAVGVSGGMNGVGTAASFDTPVGVTVDALGNVYVAELLGHRVRKITPTPAP